MENKKQGGGSKEKKKNLTGEERWDNNQKRTGNKTYGQVPPGRECARKIL